MAYLSFSELGGAAPTYTAPTHAAPVVPVADTLPVAGRLTVLEWSIIEMARDDRLRTLRQPGRLTRLWRMLARQPNPMLSNARLEALRRMAVLTWHHGYTVAAREVRAFLHAGYTPDHYEALVGRVAAARAPRRRTVTA